MDITLTIRPGAGGEESQDFALILSRMYIAWIHRHGYAGIEKSSHGGGKPSEYKITVWDVDAGKLDGEHGIHRLCRISPFDPRHRRHTSFASVEISGVLNESNSPIRNYVLDPYKTAQDLRKNYSTEFVDDVLGGGEELDKMMEAAKDMFAIGDTGAHFERRTLTRAEMDHALTLVPTIDAQTANLGVEQLSSIVIAAQNAKKVLDDKRL